MSDQPPLLIYDGECGFCTASARWVAQQFRHGESARPWQLLGEAAMKEFGLAIADVESAAWWISRDGTRHRGHRAIAHALLSGGTLRRTVGHVVLMPPGSWAAAVAYRLVVRWRHHLPGATPACRVESEAPGDNG